MQHSWHANDNVLVQMTHFILSSKTAFQVILV